jgi:hypothetical protein
MTKMNNPQDLENQYVFEERILRRIPPEIFGFSLVIACASLLLFSPRTSLCILAGGAFSTLSFLWLKQAIARFLGQDKKKAMKSGILIYLLRLLLIIAIFSIIILLFPRMILAFAAGFSTIILAFFIEAVRAISQMKQWKG